MNFRKKIDRAKAADLSQAGPNPAACPGPSWPKRYATVPFRSDGALAFFLAGVTHASEFDAAG
jgi:hypothetical protein